ncbi:MAG: hypothetical protein ACTSV7_05550 [Candidatus Baldrarchaeia archaeon]|nr:hypothetical protein [Candidatus Baldrarchaeota archaeon]OYT27485.1 MAG: hypothetical protein B6U95_06115 [Thermofilum sp. ex4484_82]OYT37679.1 MAG: hypothetical protein B6U96_06105 [Archaeoglobales archaeon ex4484_92]
MKKEIKRILNKLRLKGISVVLLFVATGIFLGSLFVIAGFLKVSPLQKAFSLISAFIAFVASAFFAWIGDIIEESK